MVVSNTIIQNIVAIAIVTTFILTLLLPKLWKFLTNGIILFALGLLPLLYIFNKISFNVVEIPVFQYLLMIIIIWDGRELIVEGIKEDTEILKWMSIVFGIILIVLGTIPLLFKLGAISFNIPQIPEVILYSIYMISGLLLAMGAFVFAHE